MAASCKWPMPPTLPLTTTCLTPHLASRSLCVSLWMLWKQLGGTRGGSRLSEGGHRNYWTVSFWQGVQRWRFIPSSLLPSVSKTGTQTHGHTVTNIPKGVPGVPCLSQCCSHLVTGTYTATIKPRGVGLYKSTSVRQPVTDPHPPPSQSHHAGGGRIAREGETERGLW